MTVENKNIDTKEVFVEAIKNLLSEMYNDCEVIINKVTKNNGLVLTGVTIMNKESNIAPTVYIDDFYDEYNEGRDLQSICDSIKDIYESHKDEVSFNIKEFSKFENVKDKICFKLINAKSNEELLKDLPHRIYNDLAIVYYVVVSKEDENMATVTVHNSILNLWDVEEDYLYELAKENTSRLRKGFIVPIADVIFGALLDIPQSEENEGINGRTVTDKCIYQISPDEMLYVASNKDKINGASILLYDNVLKTFAQKIDNDFYILPSSIHELIFIPALEDVDNKFLLEIVGEVNHGELAPQEILSNNIYRYHRDTEEIEVIYQ